MWRHRPAIQLPNSDSEDEDEHFLSAAAAAASSMSFHRQAIPPLVSDLPTRWRRESAESRSHDNNEKLSMVEAIILLLTVVKNIIHEDMKSASTNPELSSATTYLVPNIASILSSIVRQLRSSAADSQTTLRAPATIQMMNQKRTIDGNCKLLEGGKWRTEFRKMENKEQNFRRWKMDDLVVVGQCLVRVLFLALLQIGERSSGLTWLQHCKAVTESMDCMSESVDVLLSSDMSGRQRPPSLLMLDYVLSCWIYAEGLLLRHHANTIVIATVCQATDAVTCQRGLDLTSHVLLCMMSEGHFPFSDLLKRVVAVCRLVKLMRSRYVHCCTCSRWTHRHCNITGRHSIYRHHHDALGAALHPTHLDTLCTKIPSDTFGYPTYSETLNGPIHILSDIIGHPIQWDTLHFNTASNYQHHHDTLGHPTNSRTLSTVAAGDWPSTVLANACIVSRLGIFLLGLFRHHSVDNEHVRTYILDAFDKGLVTCCCLPVDLLVAAFLVGSDHQSIDCRKKSVSVAVNVVLNDCGGSATADHCSVCDDRQLELNSTTVTDSHDSETLKGSTSDLSVSRWKSLGLHFAEILHTKGDSDSAFSLHVISQAGRLSSDGTQSLKWHLYHEFFMPLLMTTVHQLTSVDVCTNDFDGTPMSVFLSDDMLLSALKLILSALSAVVNSTAMLHQFVSSGGMEVIGILIDFDRTRRAALSLLEGLVNVENNSNTTEAECAVRNNPACDDGISDVAALDALVQQLFSDSDKIPPCGEKLRTYLQQNSPQVRRMSELWHVACRLLRRNQLFREWFVQRSGTQLAYRLLVGASQAFIALDCGPATSKIHVALFCGAQDDTEEVSYTHERSLLLLVRCALSICLRCSGLDVGIPHQVNTSHS